MTENTQATFWTTGYLPNGCKVSFTIPVTMLDAYETALAFTDALLKKGFRQSEDGVEPGEEKEAVGYVCRRVKMNDDDSETPIVDLYSTHDQLTFKMLTVYLNTPDDVKAFEAASGMRLDNMQVYASKAAPERGDKLTDKYIYAAPKPFAVIRKLNPAHAADNMKPKYKFVRWDGAAASTPAPQQAAPATAVDRRDVTSAIVEIVEAEGVDGLPVKRVIYRCAGGILAEATTLRHLKDAGYDLKGWGKVGTYDVQPTAVVTVENAGKGWTVANVKQATAEALADAS